MVCVCLPGFVGDADVECRPGENIANLIVKLVVLVTDLTNMLKRFVSGAYIKTKNPSLYPNPRTKIIYSATCLINNKYVDLSLFQELFPFLNILLKFGCFLSAQRGIWLQE